MEIRAVLGKKCSEIIHGTEEPWPECPHRQTMVSGKPVTEEFFEPRLGKYLQVSASPIWNAQKEVTGSVHIVKDVTERKRAEEALRKAHDELEERVKERTTDLERAGEQLQARLAEIGDLKRRLEQENIYLREEITLQHLHEEIIGQSDIMRKVLMKAEQVAKTDSTVLIQGETGTGKELLAREIHKLSGRKDRPLVTVNCASLPPTLIESELFGREKGAYTGALTRMVGRFEVADGSTLFLDEIGELPPEVQSKLLRVLEEGWFERLGSTKPLHVNVRIIAATNRDLARDVGEGRFRKDLFYRLNVFPLMVPPLRERSGDIPRLVWAFVRQFEKRMGKRIDTISRTRMEALQRYSWPGNVRELRNVIEHAMIVTSGKTLVIDLPHLGSSEAPKIRNLEDLERAHILSVQEKSGWRITGSGGAAEVLGLKRTTLQSKMKRLGIRRPST
jgi:formate hydrogenlyase transcriptional activator